MLEEQITLKGITDFSIVIWLSANPFYKFHLRKYWFLFSHFSSNRHVLQSMPPTDWRTQRPIHGQADRPNTLYYVSEGSTGLPWWGMEKIYLYPQWNATKIKSDLHKCIFFKFKFLIRHTLKTVYFNPQSYSHSFT